MSFLRSFKWQCAALVISVSAMPPEIFPSVFVVHGRITIPTVGTEPDDIAAARSVSA